MSRNPLADIQAFGKLDLGGAIGQVNASVGQLGQSIDQLRASLPRGDRRRPPPVWFALSSNGPATMPASTPKRITGLLPGGDTSGRGTLQIGQLFYPIWLSAYQTIYIPLGYEDGRVLRNEDVTWNPPAGTTNWDVIIIYCPDDA